LYFNGSSDGLDWAGKLHHEAVARAAKDPAAMLDNEFFNRGAADTERRVSTLFVNLHDAAVAGYVSGEYGRETAFHAEPYLLARPAIGRW
jgi:hypothetical protein